MSSLLTWTKSWDARKAPGLHVSFFWEAEIYISDQNIISILEQEEHP